MTDKCRRMINEREGYITTEITQSREGGKKKAQRKERGSWDVRGVGSSCPRARGPFSLGRSPSDSVYFSPPKQAIASSELNFWTNSLQIHFNGPSPKTETLQ